MMLQEPIHILYVDDDEDDFLLVHSLLQKVRRASFKLDRAASFEEAIRLISQPYDAYLVDYRLGKQTGLELLRAIKTYKRYAPVIMLTGMEDREVDTQAMRAGASDYLVKGDFNSEILERTIRYAIRDAQSLQSVEVNANRFRNIFERSADPIAIIDRNGTITKGNPSFISRFQFDPENTDQGLSLISLIAQSEHATLIEKTLRTDGELNDLETSFWSGNNQTIDVLISIVMHEPQAGMFQVMIKDLTSLRIKQEEDRNLRRFYSTGRIAGIIAHEVKNPLTNITLAADQLKMELPEAVLKESSDLLEIIHRNSTRINQLVSELLYSTRFTELKTAKKSINELVEEALEQAMDRIKFKKIKIEKKFSYDICDVEVDAEKVKIAFLNLIVNAVEAMEAENGVLAISTQAKDHKCIVEISDNGSGISADHLDHLFEPFFTSKEKGTGLGLTHTQNIILSHKGSIRVKSELGKGTTFIVTLNIG